MCGDANNGKWAAMDRRHGRQGISHSAKAEALKGDERAADIEAEERLPFDDWVVSKPARRYTQNDQRFDHEKQQTQTSMQWESLQPLPDVTVYYLCMIFCQKCTQRPPVE